jgi:alpha-D-xyloside xylohydrolase
MYDYSASHTVWNGIIPDYTIGEARKILAEQHKTEHLDTGVSGYKIDEVDGYDMWLWADHAEFPSGTDAESMRQLYGVLMQKMITEMYRENNIRTYGLVRASNSNGSAYPFVIYNDRYDFNEYMTGLITSGFSGVSWAPEIRHGDNASDWLRRFQLGLFSPMLLLNSWASGEKPWSNAEAAQALVDIIKFRKMLLPYLYNAYAKYCFSGIPPFRAVTLDYPQLEYKEKYQEVVLHDTDNPYLRKPPSEINDQLLIGDYLLAAFIRPNETERVIILPEGNWYNFYTKEFAGANTAMHYKVINNEVPLFVKEGGIIPLATSDGVLTVKCYGEKGKCVLYDDDGTSYDYEQGAYNEILLEFDRSGGGFIHSAEYIRQKAEKNYINFVFE